MRLEEIARQLDCELRGNPDIEINRVWPIETAVAGDLSFVANPRYVRYLDTTSAAAVIVATDQKEVDLPTLRTDEPYLAFARALRLFYTAPPRQEGVHPTAVIAPSARIGEGAAIGPHVVVEDEVVIGNGATLGPRVTINYGAEIGDDFVAYAGVTVREWVRIGNNVCLHAGVVIGSDGFGYVPVAAGRLEKLIQAGTVVLGDDVEVGANTTIDRATVGETRIGDGAKIDNLVQIGHGCDVGDHSVLAAQTGLGGSTRVGSWVQIGGQAGAAGHLSIGDASQVGGKCGVTGDIEAGSVVSGFPAQPISVWRRSATLLPRLPELFRRLRRLEKALTKTGETE